MANTDVQAPHPLSANPLDFELDIGTVVDIDYDPACEASHLNGLDSEGFVSIQGTPHGQTLFLGRRQLSLPDSWSNPEFPFVRVLPDSRILISDTAFNKANDKNTWILDRSGNIHAHFGIGSAAVEVQGLAGGQIAIAYHPLSAKRFGHRIEPQQRTAIALFDGQGRMLSSYNHEAARQNLSAENIRCMTRISPVELIFAPETCMLSGQDVLNPIVLFNCATRESTVFSAPYGSPEAVCLHHGRDGSSWILLASPEGFEDQVIAFDPTRKISHYLGAFAGIFRGLALVRADRDRTGQISGGFLAQEFAAGYDWVEPTAGELEIHRFPPQGESRDPDDFPTDTDSVEPRL